MMYADNKRYNSLNAFLKEKFQSKVAKIPLNGGFTCPNIDGTRGSGGCVYCSAAGGGDFAPSCGVSLEEQFEIGKRRLAKWENPKYIAYFQAHTNTYAPLSRLKALFERALTFENVVGLSVATRADCITEEIADYLSDLNKRSYLTVELGLQTVFDKTARRINRCHSFEEFLIGYKLLKSRGIRVCVHLINGLPDETPDMMLESTKTLAGLNIDGIKLHMLHIVRETEIAKEYTDGGISLLSSDEYVSVVCNQLEVLPPTVVIERLTGDGDKAVTLAPTWSFDKRRVLNEIDKELKRRGSFQGIYFE